MISSHGLKVSWGTCVITATSLRYSCSSPTEIEITSKSSRTAADSTFATRKLVYKSVDFFAVDPGDVSMEFLATTAGIGTTRIGHQAVLDISNTAATTNGEMLRFTCHAFLTQYAMDFAVGEMVKGNLTFKLSDS